jgi:hypothetical protein
MPLLRLQHPDDSDQETSLDQKPQKGRPMLFGNLRWVSQFVTCNPKGNKLTSGLLKNYIWSYCDLALLRYL